MIISYTTCGNYKSFLCVPKGVSWKLEVGIASMGEFSEEEGDDFVNYCVRLVTGDGMNEIVVNHEDYQYSGENPATDDEMFDLCNLIVRFAAEDAANVMERNGVHYDLAGTIEWALAEWQSQRNRRSTEA